MLAEGIVDLAVVGPVIDDVIGSHCNCRTISGIFRDGYTPFVAVDLAQTVSEEAVGSRGVNALLRGTVCRRRLLRVGL
jgi:hypothetical protein